MLSRAAGRCRSFVSRARNRLRLIHLRDDDVPEAQANTDRFVSDTPERHHVQRRPTRVKGPAREPLGAALVSAPSGA